MFNISFFKLHFKLTSTLIYLNLLNYLKNFITANLHKHLYAQVSQAGIMCRLCKICKPLFDSFPKLRPILSDINTYTCKLAKFFVPLFKPVTSNDYTVKDSFDFIKDISQQNSKLLIASLDVDSFFNNVPLGEAIDIFVKELFKANKRFQALTNNKF